MADITNKRINIYIDQQAAETALQKLQLQADGLTKKITAGQAAGKSMVAELGKLDGVNDSIKKVQSQLDNGLKPSLAQQTTLVTQLRNELKRLSESDPSFAAKLKNYKEQNTELQRMQQQIGLVTKETESWGGAFGKIFGRVAEYFTAYAIINKVSESIKEFFTGAIEKASELDKAQIRLQNTLDNLGKSDTFGKLNTDAEGLIQQFKYLEKADVFEVFNKLNTYGKLSETQMQALTKVIIDFSAKSGQSLTESTSTLIKALEGNARGLKEYGIAIKDGSNVSERFGIIMDQLKPRVEGAGKAFEKSFAGKAAIAEEQVNRLKETIGNDLLPFIEGYNDNVAKIAEGLVDLFTSSEDKTKELTETFHQQKEEVDNLEKSVLPLANRYDELKAKTNLSKVEQTEMKGIIDQIVNVMPGAVTQFDKYGNAIAISTSRVREFIVAEKARLQVVNADAIEENQKRLDEINKRIAFQKQDIDAITKKGTFDVAESSSGGTGGASLLIRKATQEEIAAKEDLYKNLLQQQLGYQTELKKLRGQDLDDFKEKNTDAVKSNEQTLQTLEKQLDDLNAKLKTLPIGSKEFTDTQNEIKKVQAEIDAAMGKVNKSLEKQANSLDEAKKKWAELQQKIENGLARKTQDPFIEQINEILQKREELKKQIVEIGTAAHASQDEIKKTLEANNQLALAQAQAVGKAAITAVQNKIRSSNLKAPTTKNPDKEQVDFLNDPDLDLIGARVKAHQKIYDEDTKNAKDAEEKQLENLVGYASQVTDIYTTIANFKTNQENAAFNKEVKLNESRKKSLQSLLNGKLISQNQYNKETQKLDDDLDKKKQDLERKQFNRNKVTSIAETLIAGAQGEIKLWDELGVGAIPWQIVLGAETLAKVALIAAQKPSFGKGGALTGPSHAQGGMPVINPTTGAKEAEVEGGEYIISKNTVRNNKGLADALLFTSLYRNGAPVNRNYVPVDYAGITKTYNHLKFALGGVMPAANPVAGKSSGEDLTIVLNAILQSLNTPSQPIIIQNSISLKQLEEAQAQKANIVANANFKG
jgi:chromosome segregation ATPase